MARMLVIDDDEQLRGILLEMLKATGHVPDGVSNGLDGLRHFRAMPSDVVITDMMMPYDGLATIQLLRKESPNVGIIAMSGGPTFRLDYARGMGARTTLRKPFTVEELTVAITDALAGSPADAS